MIKTWQERCEEHPDHQTGMVSNQMIMARMQEEIDDLRAALAEPEQPCEYIRSSGSTHWCALAEAGPRREWVGLTPEEMMPFCEKNLIVWGAYTVDFIFAIQAKLKEKNS